MKTTFNSSMFDSIKTALESAKSKGTGTNFKNILSISAPATYVVRLIPNVKTPKETFLHYYHHGWKSVSTGQYAGVTSPSTWGERCPVSELYFKIMRDGTEEEKARAKEHLKRKENWFVNVYVVNDPKNPENNGTIKVLRFGKQLNKIIESAINGDDASEFGPKIFDLSENGCNLRIKAELVSEKSNNKQFASYTASKFLSPSAIEGLDEAKIEEIHKNIFDLNQFVDRKDAKEITDFINVHWFNNGAEPAKVPAAPVAEDEDVPYEAPKPVAPKASATTKTVAKPASDESANDDKVKNILASLEDLD